MCKGRCLLRFTLLSSTKCIWGENLVDELKYIFVQCVVIRRQLLICQSIQQVFHNKASVIMLFADRTSIGLHN